MDNWPQVETHSQYFAISGPSGSGKSTLISRLLQEFPEIVPSISMTTRAPRGQEKHGKDYFFVDEESFRQAIADDALLEYATVFGKHSYGTPRDFVSQCFDKGLHVICDIDVQGAFQIRRRLPHAVLIFILPPSRALLEERLRARKTDSDEAILKRLAAAEEEMSHCNDYNYYLVNDDLETAYHQLKVIVEASMLRTRGAEDSRVPAYRKGFGPEKQTKDEVE